MVETTDAAELYQTQQMIPASVLRGAWLSVLVRQLDLTEQNSKSLGRASDFASRWQDELDLLRGPELVPFAFEMALSEAVSQLTAEIL